MPAFPSYKFKLTDKEVTVNIGNNYIEIQGYKDIVDGQTIPPYDSKTIHVKRVNKVQDFRSG